MVYNVYNVHVFFRGTRKKTTKLQQFEIDDDDDSNNNVHKQ